MMDVIVQTYLQNVCGSLCPILMRSELTYSFLLLECAIPKLWGSRVIGTANGSSEPMEFAFDGEAVSNVHFPFFTIQKNSK